MSFSGTDDEPADALPAGALVGGAYRVSRVLGRGGSGTVYLATREPDGAVCALKLLRARPGGDEAARRRFDREARIAERVQSPYVARVLGAGVDEATGAPFIASEFLPGENLGKVVDRAGALRAVEALVLAEQLCAALSAAHAAGVIHRDVKPENVMLVPSPSGGNIPFGVKLLDFGIARGPDGSARIAPSRVGASAPTPVLSAPRRSEDITAPPPTTSAIGSPLWMAPELVNLLPADAGTDLWSLGLLLFWALTGKVYWLAAHASPVRFDALLTEKLFAEIEPASARARALGCEASWPGALDPWFARCVSRERAARFASALDAWSALHPALARAAAGQRPRALPDGGSPALRRRTSVAARGALGAASLVAGIALGAHVLQRNTPPAAAPVAFATVPQTESAGARVPEPAPNALTAGAVPGGRGSPRARTSASSPAPRVRESTPTPPPHDPPAADAATTATVAPVPPTNAAQADRELHEILGICWEKALTREPGHGDEVYRVEIDIGTDGRASSVRVNGLNDGELSVCVRDRLRAHRFPPLPAPLELAYTTRFPMH